MNNNNWQELPLTAPNFDFTHSLVNDWMLVTAGRPEDLGTMTVSWGGSGFIWKKNVVFLVIRQSRNTLCFLEKHQDFTLSLFDESFRDKLTYCGRHTGREVDKVAVCEFTPCFYGPKQTPYFNESHTVLVCHQIYRSLMTEDFFLDGSSSDLWQTWYNTGIHTGDKHLLIIASIENILTKGEDPNV